MRGVLGSNLLFSHGGRLHCYHGCLWRVLDGAFLGHGHMGEQDHHQLYSRDRCWLHALERGLLEYVVAQLVLLSQELTMQSFVVSLSRLAS